MIVFSVQLFLLEERDGQSSVSTQFLCRFQPVSRSYLTINNPLALAKHVSNTLAYSLKGANPIPSPLAASPGFAYPSAFSIAVFSCVNTVSRFVRDPGGSVERIVPMRFVKVD